MDALNASFHAEISETEFYKRYGRILHQATLTPFALHQHLAGLGLARVDECHACCGSGADQADPERRLDCPNCAGNGFFRIPLAVHPSPEPQH